MWYLIVSIPDLCNLTYFLYIHQRVLLSTALAILIDLVARNRSKFQCWKLSAWHITQVSAFKDSNNSLTKDYYNTFNTRNTRTEFDSKYPLSVEYVLIKYLSSTARINLAVLHAVLELLVYVQWSNKVFNSNFIQCILYQLWFV